MQPYNKAVMTDKAIELLNKAQAGLCQIEITRMAIGDGEYLSAEKKEEYLKGQLELKNEKNSYPISSKGVSSDNSIIITAILSNQDPITFETLIEKGYCISEIGIFAKENGTDDEILYSIAVAEKLGDYMPAFEGSNPAQIIQSYQITVNNMETAEVVINYAGAAMLASEGQAHVENQERHITAGERENWNNKLEADSDILKEAIDDAKVALLAIGANPTLEGSTDAPFITFKGKGEIEQQTYIGKNLVDFEDFTLTAGESSSYTHKAFSGMSKIEKNKTYNVSFYTDFTGNITTKFTNYNATVLGVELNMIPANGRYSKSFTTPDDLTNFNTYLIYAGTGGATEGNTVNVWDIQIEEGTEATYYEPYVGGTASPNPDYPQEIHGVGESGSLEVKSTGKNIFGGLPFAQAIVDTGSTNVVLDTNAKTVTFSHNTTYQNKYILFENFKRNTQYTFIFNGKSPENTSNTQFSVNYTDGTSIVISWNGANKEQTIAFITDSNKSVSNIAYKWINANATNILNYEQCGIFEGVITAEEFEPYTETTANIPLSAPLYEDAYIRYNMDGSGEESHKKKRLILDDNRSDWKLLIQDGIDGSTVFACFPFLDDRLYSSICSHFTPKSRIAWADLPYGCFMHVDHALGFSTNFSTLDEFNAWLAENPITVVYELAEPTVTPLTAEQIAEFEKLRTFDGVTNVTCEGECEVQYLTESESGKAVAAVVSKVNNGMDALEAAINKAIADLINGAPGTLDTLKEIADAMAENEDVVEALEKAIGERAKTTDLTEHTGNKSNPHGVTKAQVGLGNVNNTSDADKPVSTAQQKAIDKAIAYDKGVIAEFDYETGEISDAVEANMTVPTVIDHLQAVISDIIGGVMANKENLELPVGSVIMMETGTGTNYELPKYGTWSYELTQIFEETSSGAAKAIHVKLYKRTS